MKRAILGLGFLLVLLTWTAVELIATAQMTRLDAQGRWLTRTDYIHLPASCGRYYNDCTERWINCMGVGYVREEDEEHD